MIDVIEPLIQRFMPFAQKKMGFSRPPKLFLRQDEQNGADPMGKTGFYDPEKESITLYITGRHPKDVMRSLAHELQHHTQKCNGQFESVQNMGEEGYAQSDPHMRSMEIEAYQASIVFRDWEDSTKGTIYYEHLQKGDNSSMSTKNWKNGELKSLLAESWGFNMDLSRLNEKADKNTGMSGLKGDDDDDTYEGHFKKDTLEEDDTPDAMYEAYEAYESVQLQQESRSLKSKNKTLITEQKTLNKKVRLLEEKLQKYGTVINKLKDKLNETNLTNAKLLYQNRVLDSASLNERQKDRIVETIMNAKTVEEAKIIYETLQSAVGANTLSRKPKSLNEVVTKRSSAFMPRKEEKRVDPFTVRMKALAGIKD